MYSNHRSVEILTSLMEAHQIKDVVLCPGSRNVPIVLTLAHHAAFRCHQVTDERSAGFYALGVALQTHRAVAVCCTSGTALLNLHPAVAEAFYQQIPLLVLSADRPRQWIGQMDGQTLPQENVFGGLVRREVSLPEIQTPEDEWYCNRLVNEALLELQHGVKGPVHLNLPLKEPLFDFPIKELRPERVIHRVRSLKEVFEPLGKCHRGMILLGQNPLQEELALDKRFVCLGEHLSNHGNELLKRFDAVLYAADEPLKQNLSPDLLITMGGHIVSKRLKKFLRQYPPREHWHISPRGEVVDLFQCLTTVIETTPQAFLDELRQVDFSFDSDFKELWTAQNQRVEEPSLPFSEMSVVGDLLHHLPKDSILHLANSSTVRYAQLFDISPSVEVLCNRGTSGIEGSLSTAVGYARVSDKLNFVVIGDLSFFYDMNALWGAKDTPNLRILLLNNAGGEIFHALPGLGLEPSTQKFVVAEHHSSARGWAEEQSFMYHQVQDASQWEKVMQEFTSSEPTSSPILVEVFTRKEEDVAELKKYYHHLRK